MSEIDNNAGADESAAQAVLPTLKKRGRPIGWQMATFADLNAFTIEDFAFLRGILGGMEPMKAFLHFYANRHFDAQGNPVVPHGLSIRAKADQMIRDLTEAGRASSSPEFIRSSKALATPWPDEVQAPMAEIVATHMSYDDWADTQEPDFFSEHELNELYLEYLKEQGASDSRQQTAHLVINRSDLIKAKIDAINLLQTHLAVRPTPTSPASIWFAKSIHQSFAVLGIDTMQGVVEHIGAKGRHWHRGIKGLGPGRAKRVEAWLDSHSPTLGPINRDGEKWRSALPLSSAIVPLSRVSDTQELTALPGQDWLSPVDSGRLRRRSGIAPLELLLVPREIDGRNGLFRSQAPNHYGASNDQEALFIWLGSYLNAGKTRTFDAYRRELERFYVWCINEAGVALSGVSLAHALGYQAFLKNIPDRYISEARVVRESDKWRPWRGQLDQRSQNYALGVVSQFYNDATKNAYLSGNPFASLRTSAAKTRVMDTTRSLTQQDLDWVRESMTALPGLDSKHSLTAAIDRRTQLILQLALTTGMRLEEMATTTLKGMRRAVVDGVEQEDEWVFSVTGKGKKVRDIPVSGRLIRMIQDHHADVQLQMKSSMGQESPRMQALRDRPPLICALRAPVGHTVELIDDTAQMANDNLALGRVGLYRTLKSFFASAARKPLKVAMREQVKVRAALAHAKATNNQEKLTDLKSADAALAYRVMMWQRRSKVSTHWLRHTFALAVLKSNPDDAGLKMAQQLLGHASITTTAEYVKQDESSKVKAVMNIDPLGMRG